MPNYNDNYIKAKLDKAAKRFGLSGKGPTKDRLPPGQYLTEQFPILDLGERPPLELKDFNLRLFGEIPKEVTVSSEEFLKLPSVELTKEFHCVTRWSKYDIKWRGIPFEEILKIANPLPEAKYVIFYSRDLYTTNVPLVDCLREGVILAYELEGKEIPLLHGGPVRALVPHLYGWKSAKFLRGIKFSSRNEEGFWESRGYHMYGDPWKEERYS